MMEKILNHVKFPCYQDYEWVENTSKIIIIVSIVLTFFSKKLFFLSTINGISWKCQTRRVM
jgi:hypothetical protein